MKNSKQILVPVDFYQHTEKLVEFAIGVADEMKGKVIFLHVMESLMSYPGFRPETYKQFDAEITQHAERNMRELLSETKKKYSECTGVLLGGDVVDSIVTYVDENSIDLIIIGTHGAKGIEKILMGSVAERVLKRASCPTLIFNPYKGAKGYQVNAIE